MTLKTNYKNDKFAGMRKYQIVTNNVTGLSTIEDKTDYVETGDVFSADDINTTNKTVNQNQEYAETQFSAIKGEKIILVSKGNWSLSEPYEQTISVPGITENDSPIIGGPYLGDNPSKDIAKLRNKSFGYIDRGVSENGGIRLYCYNTKPVIDFSIMVKGV